MDIFPHFSPIFFKYPEHIPIFAVQNEDSLTRAENSKKMKVIYTILLLICSNVFMTFAWYGHLKLQEMKIPPDGR